MALDTTQYATTVSGRGDVPITTYAPNTTLGYSNDTIDAIPGLRDALANGGRGGNGIGLAGLNDAMSNPTAYAENNLMLALQSKNQDQINANVQFLNQQGLDINQIQDYVQNQYTQYQQNAASSGMFGDSFIGNVLNTVTSPENIAALMANAIVPGSGALVKTIEDISGGKQNLTNDLENLAISGAISGTGLGQAANSGISNEIQDLTGASSKLANGLATGALSTAGSLASGQNLQNALAQGTINGLNSGFSSQQTSSPDPNSPNYIGAPQGTSPLLDSSGNPLPSTITSTLEPKSSSLDTSGEFTQTNSGNGLGNTLPMSPSGAYNSDPTQYSSVQDMANSVASGNPISTPSLNDITQEVNPTDATGNSNLTAQILPSTTDVISTVNNFDGTSTVTYADGSIQTIETPNSAPNYDGSGGFGDYTRSGSGGLNISVPNTSKNSSKTSGTGLSSTSGGLSALSSAPSMLAGAPAYGTPSNIEQPLKQIYSNMTPESNNASTNQSTSNQQTSQNDILNQLTPELLQQLLNQQTKFVASGGSIDDQMMVKPIHTSPSMLGAAPTNEYYSAMGQKQNSRINALKSLYAGIGTRPSNPFNQMAKGGLPSKYEEASPKGHNPEFITGLTGYYAQGGGTGQSDDIPAMLHQGDYVMDADTVAALGDGSSKAGAHTLEKLRTEIPHHTHDYGEPVPAQIADGEYVFPASFVSSLGGGDNKRGAELLDKMREELRKHKRSAPTNKIPPKAKSPLSYLKSAKG